MIQQLGAVPLTSDVLSRAQIGLWAFELDDDDAPRMFADETMCRMLGVTGDKSPNDIYNCWYDNIDPHHYDEVMASVEKMISGTYAEVQYPFHHPTEGIMLVRCGGVRNFSYEKGIRIEGCHQNVTDVIHYQVKTEEQQKVRILNAIISDFTCVFSMNLKNRIGNAVLIGEKYSNTMKKLMSRAINLTEVFDIYVQEYVHPTDRVRVRNITSSEFLRRELAHRQRFTVQYRHMLDDRVKYLELIVAKTEDGDAVPENVLFIFCDIDERVREEVHRQNDLENALQVAQATNDAKSAFLFKMSHDLRTPMDSILGFTDMAQKNVGNPEKLMDSLNKLSFSGKQLLGVINDLLDVSRIENDSMELDLQPVQALAALDEFMDVTTSFAKEHNINLAIDREDALAADMVLWVDRQRLNRILMNVFSNALKYSHSGGTVRIQIKGGPSARPGHIHCSFVVEDDGVGVSSDFQKNILDDFSREQDSVIGQLQGPALGLVITKGLVDLMGGTLKVDSAQGKGTKVTLNFEFRIATDGLNSVKEGQAKDLSLLKDKRVLLVEDNDLNREITKEILLDSGLFVEEAEDGTEAIEFVQRMLNAHEKTIDFILMDIQMPIMNGYTATSEILRMAGFEELNIPIIALSANASEDDKIRSLASGMKKHVTKPIKGKELLESLLSCL